MPVKWTTENDLLLLITLLETHSIPRLEPEKITAAWPSTVTEVPTQRAIRDRIRFLRNVYTTGVKKENGDPYSSSTPANKRVGKNTPKAGKEKWRLNLDQDDSGDDENKDRKMNCILAVKEMKKEEGEGFMGFKKEIDIKMHMEPIEIDDDDDDDDLDAFGQGSITDTRSKKRKAPGAAHAKGLQGWEATTASAKMVVERMKLKKHKSNGNVHNHQDDEEKDSDI